jgi:hypothetical protein
LIGGLLAAVGETGERVMNISPPGTGTTATLFPWGWIKQKPASIIVFMFVHHLVSTMEWVEVKELDFKFSTHPYAFAWRIGVTCRERCWHTA